MQYKVLATDYDGTIAHDGVVPPETIASLRKAKAAGMQLYLVTGRRLNDLLTLFAHWKLFDWIVAENGPVLFDTVSEQSRSIASPPPLALLERLEKEGVPLAVGHSVVATYDPHGDALRQAIRDLGLDWHIILNKGAVMALPPGVSKASGLIALLKVTGISSQQVVAVGDAENDLTFLQASGFPVAVANALPSVKAAAKWVTPSPRGEGVSELIERLLGDAMDGPTLQS